MILSNIIGFMWDAGNYEKCQKHGVSIEETEYIFQTKPLLFSDLKHSSEEYRFIIIGKSCKNKYIFVVFTVVDQENGKHIRPISVRYMHQKEVNRYGKKLPDLSK
jgi:uncharacterized DUF497 family protein